MDDERGWKVEMVVMGVVMAAKVTIKNGQLLLLQIDRRRRWATDGRAEKQSVKLKLKINNV